ncbi:hypothetical protein [Sodalis glossinidius]|uniref:hypothetical protein n=1 Tax=Sodalis glossinidius TaxID=63612 RepID=UPI0003027058|nr:hypothetical protein [Sodalis glossinidius]
MKKSPMLSSAQVIALSKIGKKQPESQSETTHKNHISIESYHKFNRSRDVSVYIYQDLIRREIHIRYPDYIPHLFSYIHDDIVDIFEEIKKKGLCDEWLRQQAASESMNTTE